VFEAVRLFEIEGKAAKFARTKAGLVVHVVSLEEWNELKASGIPCDKLGAGSWANISNPARALGFNV
jgi:hypothetical protein